LCSNNSHDWETRAARFAAFDRTQNAAHNVKVWPLRSELAEQEHLVMGIDVYKVEEVVYFSTQPEEKEKRP
jgi:hypothetical protein